MNLTKDNEKLILLLAKRRGSTQISSFLRELKTIPEGGEAAHLIRNLLQTVSVFAEGASLDEFLDGKDCEPALKRIASFEHGLEQLPVDFDLRRYLKGYLQELREQINKLQLANP